MSRSYFVSLAVILMLSVPLAGCREAGIDEPPQADREEAPVTETATPLDAATYVGTDTDDPSNLIPPPDEPIEESEPVEESDAE